MRITSVLCVFAIAGALVLGGMQRPAGAASTVTVQIATGDPGVDFYKNTKKATLMVFADYLTRISGGRMTCKLAVGALGGEAEVFQQTMLGTNEIAITTEGPASSILRDWNVLNIPYLFASDRVVETILDGPFGKELGRELEKKSGVRVLAFASNAGFRHIINARRPINRMEDLKGLKIRTVESPAQMKFFELMGATATPIAWGEVYTSIETGVVDGLNNNANGVLLGGLERLSRYITRDAHVYAPAIIITNAAWFDGLTPEQKNWVTEAADNARWVSRVLVQLDEAAGYEKLAREFGVQVSYFTPEEKERIKARVVPPFMDWLKGTLEDPAWIEKIRAAVAEAEAALKIHQK